VGVCYGVKSLALEWPALTQCRAATKRCVVEQLPWVPWCTEEWPGPRLLGKLTGPVGLWER
jgi:hypothetical protein